MAEDIRKQTTAKRMATLMEEYEAVSLQISNTLNPADRLRLERQAEDLSRQIDKLQHELATLAANESPQNGLEEFPFTNRHDELKLLLSSFAPAYHIIDAPAGYGKTKLLHRLQEQFNELGWIAIYVSVGLYDRLTNISQAIADAIGIRHIFDQLPHLPPGIRLGSALNFHWQTIAESDKKGLVFLIDIEAQARPATVQSIQEDLIPQVRDGLKTLAFFAQSHNPFRVVIAGRYLTLSETAVPAYPTNIQRLSTFTYQVVRDSARQYLQGFSHDVVDNLTAHLVYLTGGHPGCIAEILQIYRQSGLPPDIFLQQYGEQVWEQVVKRYTEDIYGIVAEHGDILNKLSVFRYLDYAVLEAFVSQYDLEIDAYSLSDLLTGAYLLNWDGRYLKDDIIRRLLAINLRQLSADKFVAYSQYAQEIYKEFITNKTTMGPDRWAIEYLFLVLHKNACDIHNEDTRIELSHHFFQNEVPKALNLLVEGRGIPRRQWRAEKEAISRALHQDWEFQFTINYYLRNHHYSTQPYQQLQQEITNFFND